MLRREGVSVGGDAPALRIELHVVVEHGLNLAEVAATMRSQVAYEVERLTGLTSPRSRSSSRGCRQSA